MAEQAVRFYLPPELEAHQPAELRGVRRDQVRLLVLPRLQGPMVHTQFDALEEFLCPGDLLVVNTSRTLPALLRAHDEGGKPVAVRLARAESLGGTRTTRSPRPSRKRSSEPETCRQSSTAKRCSPSRRRAQESSLPWPASLLPTVISATTAAVTASMATAVWVFLCGSIPTTIMSSPFARPHPM